jgi:hypothetical protein
MVPPEWAIDSGALASGGKLDVRRDESSIARRTGERSPT